MRSPQPVSDTRTRILDAAVGRFGRDGFAAPLRTVAADAGVSAAAIIKHFGSKEALHTACDEHVLEIIGHHKREAMQSSDLRATFLAQMAVLDEFQPLIRYFVRSLLTGGDVARHLLTEMRSQAMDWMRDGVAAGNLRPSRNEELRVKFTFSASIGWMVQSVLAAGVELGELDSTFWRRTFEEMMLPALEVYTEGLLSDRAMLDEYLLYVGDPPGSDAPDDDAVSEPA
ncbi:TetR/AcrR family transcriptional regulator [Georgenia sp. H159]|uniref:TetR/AcrR family transcriptional regulator n=1 Tax=Georgenia sp. H159 TaxID=3076115 RepID=UPI002D765F4B|nr:TetR family transcriptional regulator [Georgenia sp. H159]